MEAPQDNNEQAKIVMAESAESMASTMFWKALVRALAVDEANVLAELDKYLCLEPHPDREEVMTLCLKWHARRTHRRLLLENVELARYYKSGGQGHAQMPEEFMAPSSPLPEEVEAMLGEM